MHMLTTPVLPEKARHQHMSISNKGLCRPVATASQSPSNKAVDFSTALDSWLSAKQQVLATAFEQNRHNGTATRSDTRLSDLSAAATSGQH